VPAMPFGQSLITLEVMRLFRLQVWLAFAEGENWSSQGDTCGTAGSKTAEFIGRRAEKRFGD
jgi:hypothetical protein